MTQKIWDDHLVAEFGDGLDLVRMDRVVLHDRGGGTALHSLSRRNRRVRSPTRVFATADHIVDTIAGRTGSTMVPAGPEFLAALRAGCREHDITLWDLDDERQGIVHVISPELGIALPGCTLACHDSHTCTVGGVGALGFGMGASEIEHVLCTDTLVLARPPVMRVELTGSLPRVSTAKDLVLWLIGVLGAEGGLEHIIEFSGPTVQRMGVEQRLTLCNMAVELGARTGLVAPDDATFEYLHGKPWAPHDKMWDAAVSYWQDLVPDDGAFYDRSCSLDCGALAPQVTWGTNPEQVTTVDEPIPDPLSLSPERRAAADRALRYMGLVPGATLRGTPLDGAFLGSCTNGRLSDLRAAARILRGRRVARGLRALCVPGSTHVRRQAEREGLDRIFYEAGFEWREAGCSLCFNAGNDGFGPGQRVVTSTNRNFENRQGTGTRSHLASPVTVALSAIAGQITDARQLAGGA
ncbi:MAG: 3-isopropylmalate dehydratase large subunit [Myxococcota bacterium]